MRIIVTSIIICILAAAEVDIFVPGLTRIREEFDISPFMVQFTLSANFVSFCISCLVMGIVGDKYGRGSVISYSLVIFIVGSIFCMMADYFPLLLLGRILQGIGIAGPSSLGYVIVSDQYSAQKQASIIGALHGVVTFVMAGAPILGSYLTHQFGWRSNFIALFVLGVICLILSLLFIPNSKKTAENISLSLKSYLPLLRSKELMMPVISMCFFIASFWVFVGFAPIVYMEGFGITLEEFGYCQGTLIIAFSISSLLSSFVIKKIGRKNALHIGCSLYFIHAILILASSILGIKDPVIITSFMVIGSIGAVYPINVFFPISLEIIKDSKARASSLINALRLIMTSVGLCIVSFVYNDTFIYLGLWVSITVIIGVFMVYGTKECRTLLKNIS